MSPTCIGCSGGHASPILAWTFLEQILQDANDDPATFQELPFDARHISPQVIRDDFCFFLASEREGDRSSFRMVQFDPECDAPLTTEIFESIDQPYASDANEREVVTCGANGEVTITSFQDASI